MTRVKRFLALAAALVMTAFAPAARAASPKEVNEAIDKGVKYLYEKGDWTKPGAFLKA